LRIIRFLFLIFCIYILGWRLYFKIVLSILFVGRVVREPRYLAWMFTTATANVIPNSLAHGLVFSWSRRDQIFMEYPRQKGILVP
jgi:hypothetical protein